MKLFGQIVRTAINVATLPVAVAKDVVTLGGVMTERRRPYTASHLEKTALEAMED